MTADTIALASVMMFVISIFVLLGAVMSEGRGPPRRTYRSWNQQTRTFWITRIYNDGTTDSVEDATPTQVSRPANQPELPLTEPTSPQERAEMSYTDPEKHVRMVWSIEKNEWVPADTDIPVSLVRAPVTSYWDQQYEQGWKAFDLKDFLTRGAEKMPELCPHPAGSFAAKEWWRGYYASGTIDWRMMCEPRKSSPFPTTYASPSGGSSSGSVAVGGKYKVPTPTERQDPLLDDEGTPYMYCSYCADNARSCECSWDMDTTKRACSTCETCGRLNEYCQCDTLVATKGCG